MSAGGAGRIGRRAALLAGLAGIAAALGFLGRLVQAVAPPPLEHEPLAGLPPFRRLDLGGAASVADRAFVGLVDPAAARREAAVEAEVAAAPCAALFGGWPEGGALPLAFFSDFRRPSCRALERDLALAVARAAFRVRLVHHEWPILGPPSELAARASAAGKPRARPSYAGASSPTRATSVPSPSRSASTRTGSRAPCARAAPRPQRHARPRGGAHRRPEGGPVADPPARVLRERLQAAHPERYPEGLLRTVQRRLKLRRAEKARVLVFADSGAASSPAPAPGDARSLHTAERIAGDGRYAPDPSLA